MELRGQRAAGVVAVPMDRTVCVLSVCVCLYRHMDGWMDGWISSQLVVCALEASAHHPYLLLPSISSTPTTLPLSKFS